MAGISGSERYLLSILPELKKKNINVTFLVLQHPKQDLHNKEFIKILESQNIPVFILSSYFSISPLMILRAMKLIKNNAFSILHSNLIHADLMGAVAKKFFFPKITLISTKHGYTEAFQAKFGFDVSKLKPNLFFLLSRWAARYADRVVCISDSLLKFYRDSRMISEDKLVTIPYGFNFPLALTNSSSAISNFGSPQIVITGRLEAVKQHHLLFQVMPDLILKFPDIALVIVGSGSLDAELKNLALKLGINKHVHMIGFQDNVHPYIAASDLMVIPSRSEGFGLVILEAWHHSKPVIGFDVPALNDIVDTYKDGILVQPFSISELYAAIVDLLSSSERLEAYGANGHQKQKEQYTLEVMVSATLAELLDAMPAKDHAANSLN